jgi:hypothetical protein
MRLRRFSGTSAVVAYGSPSLLSLPAMTHDKTSWQFPSQLRRAKCSSCEPQIVDIRTVYDIEFFRNVNIRSQQGRRHDAEPIDQGPSGSFRASRRGRPTRRRSPDCRSDYRAVDTIPEPVAERRDSCRPLPHGRHTTSLNSVDVHVIISGSLNGPYSTMTRGLSIGF